MFNRIKLELITLATARKSLDIQRTKKINLLTETSHSVKGTSTRLSNYVMKKANKKTL